MGKSTGIWGEKSRDMGKGTGIWGKVQGYGERYRDVGKGTEMWGKVQRCGEEYLRIKVKFFRLTYFTFGFILPMSILIF
jgi:hypothetical protein